MAEINQDVGTLTTSPIHRGTDVTLSVSVTNQADAAVDLNGVQSITYSMYGVSPSKDFEAPAVVTKTLSDGVSVSNAAGGVFDVVIEGSDTLNLWPGEYFHQAVLVTSQSETFVPIEGTFKLKAINT